MIRAARPEDIDGVLALWGGARSTHAATADSPELVAGLVATGALLVAVEDGAVAAR